MRSCWQKLGQIGASAYTRQLIDAIHHGRVGEDASVWNLAAQERHQSRAQGDPHTTEGMDLEW